MTKSLLTHRRRPAWEKHTGERFGLERRDPMGKRQDTERGKTLKQLAEREAGQQKQGQAGPDHTQILRVAKCLIPDT